MPSRIAHTASVEVENDGVVVTATSAFTGHINKMFLPTTLDKVEAFFAGKYDHELIQRVFPELDNTQREFLLTGTTQEEWDDAFPEEDDEEGYSLVEHDMYWYEAAPLECTITITQDGVTDDTTST